MAVERIRQEYLRNDLPWFIGFSGGKDSSALLKLVYAAVLGAGKPHKPVTVIYCDTGVEIPVVTALVRRTLRALVREAAADRVPFRVKVAKPPLADRYFVKVIGRGYPPPTNKFRWCTDRLRIDPVRRLIGAAGDDAVVLLGTRLGESSQRDRTLARQSLGRDHFYRQSGNSKAQIYAPISDFSLLDVWAVLFQPGPPRSLDADALRLLYQSAGSECPIVRDPQGTPCGAGRFGCWTCTVVRKDKAVTSMVADGHARLRPLLDFRNWLMAMRDDPANRCRFRRNGKKGLGPLTLSARREAMRRLNRAGRATGWTLVTANEVHEIRRLWSEDQLTSSYRE